MGLTLQTRATIRGEMHR